MIFVGAVRIHFIQRIHCSTLSRMWSGDDEMTAFELFALMMLGHFLGDYPLQGEFLARGKNRSRPLPGFPWHQILFAHAVIHGGLVALAVVIAGISGYPELLRLAVVFGLAETFVHVAIDDGKCRGTFGFNVDQSLHALCKLIWTIAAVLITEMPLLIAP